MSTFKPKEHLAYSGPPSGMRLRVRRAPTTPSSASPIRVQVESAIIAN